MMDSFSLAGKVAIVTGSNTGLGQGMALGLAQAGADIVGVSRSEPGETPQMVEELGCRFLDVRVDLSKMESLETVISQSVEAFGQVDILVNNAGIIRRNDAIDFSEEDWDDVMNVNLKSVFFLSQLFARQAIQKKMPAKIINIASMLSFQGGIRVPSYTSSKSGVLGMTRLMANEWAKYNINVNAIAPGYMATNNTEALRDDETRNNEILSRIPAGEWGKPEDLAGPVVFLASEASRYVQGYTLAVDGGWLAR